MARSRFTDYFYRFNHLVILASLTLGLMVSFPHPRAIALTSVDPILEEYQMPAEVYVNNCGTCHIPIPPEVMPRETWQQLLEKPRNHYGVELKNLIGINQVLMWRYLSNYSRSLLPDETRPLYIDDSRYFKALHPKVELPSVVNHSSCLSCHSGAKDFNYRIAEEEQ